jgi:hypothetical protein
MKENNQDDEMLERLLAGLGAAPVEDGFAQRVRRGVEARVAAADSRPVRWRVARWSFASAAAAVLLCAVSVHELRHRSDATPVVQNQPTALPLVMAPGKGDEATVEPPTPRRTVPLRRKAAELDGQPATAAVVSFPAPEAPLTEQERLLLRIVHRGDPVEVAMLDPQELARQEAVEAAEFRQFFPAPDPPANDVPKDSPKEKGDTK